MREHRSHTRHYMLIVRNAIVSHLQNSVNAIIHLPGIITKVKHIFHMGDKLDLATNFDKLRGMQGEVFEEFELRRFCDIFYNPESKTNLL